MPRGPNSPLDVVPPLARFTCFIVGRFYSSERTHVHARSRFDALRFDRIAHGSTRITFLSSEGRDTPHRGSIPRPENHATPENLRLPFTTHRIESEDGIVLEAWHVPRQDAKTLVLMFHGFAACKGALLPEAKAIHELGFDVLLVDFRGSGGSSGSVTTLGIREAEDVARVFEYAQATWTQERTVLYGQSMGSVAVLRALAMHQNIQPATVVLECPFDSLRGTVSGRFKAMGLPAFPASDLLLFWGSVQMGFNGYRHNPVDYARAVRSPVLLMHGAKDARVTIEQSESIFQNLAGEKEFELFDAAGHESYLAVGPEQWKKAVSSFLARRR